MKHDPQGQPAHDQVESDGARTGALTWLALEPLTGRTHQLRVHCAEMGWPILGDAVYGSAPRHGGPPLHLHAREIAVPLYKNRDPIRVVAPVPGICASVCRCAAGTAKMIHVAVIAEDGPRGFETINKSSP